MTLPTDKQVRHDPREVVLMLNSPDSVGRALPLCIAAECIEQLQEDLFQQIEARNRTAQSASGENGDALAAALEPFAEYGLRTLELDGDGKTNSDHKEAFTRLTYGHFRAAIRAMRGETAPSHEVATEIVRHYDAPYLRKVPVSETRGNYDPNESPEELAARLKKVDAFVAACQAPSSSTGTSELITQLERCIWYDDEEAAHNTGYTDELDIALRDLDLRSLLAALQSATVASGWERGYVGGGMYLQIPYDAPQFYVAWMDRDGKTWRKNLLPLPSAPADGTGAAK